MDIPGNNEKEFLNLINKKGFVLEDKTRIIIEKQRSNLNLKELKFPFVFELIGKNEKRRIEIDGYLLTKNIQVFIECKTTENVWIAAKNKDFDNKMCLLYESNGYNLKNTHMKHKLPLSFCNYELGLKVGDSKLVQANKDDNFQPIHKASWQLINNIEATIQTFIEISSRKQNVAIIPIIVTNTDLYLVEFNDSDINDKGELFKLNSSKIVPYFAFNFQKELYWDRNGSQVVKLINLGGYSAISIFVVNITFLGEFIDIIEKFIEEYK